MRIKELKYDNDEVKRKRNRQNIVCKKGTFGKGARLLFSKPIDARNDGRHPTSKKAANYLLYTVKIPSTSFVNVCLPSFVDL